MEQKSYKKLQACVNKLAQEHDLLPQLLARKKELLGLFERHRQAQVFMLPDSWQGWVGWLEAFGRPEAETKINAS